MSDDEDDLLYELGASSRAFSGVIWTAVAVIVVGVLLVEGLPLFLAAMILAVMGLPVLGFVALWRVRNADQVRFRIHRDRVERIDGFDDSLHTVPLTEVTHLGVLPRGRLELHARSVGDGYVAWKMFAGRLHVEDRFDQLLGCIEEASPDRLYSIRERGEGARYPREWEWNEVFADDELVSRTRLGVTEERKEEFFANLKSWNDWRIHRGDSPGIRFRGTLEDVWNRDGMLVAEIRRAHGGFVVTCGSGEILRVREFSGALFEEEEKVGKLWDHETTFACDARRPMWRWMLLMVLCVFGRREMARRAGLV